MDNMKRDNKFITCMNDQEYQELDRLVSAYTFDGKPVSRSFLVRYALKRLPHQSNLILTVQP